MIYLDDDDLVFLGITPREWIVQSPPSADPHDPRNKDLFSLSAHFTDITTGPYKQDVMANFAGKKGTGKSYGSLKIAYETSIRKAEILGGQPSDYFTVEGNVAIMDAEKMIDIMTSEAKYQTIISDDSGTIQGARRYHSEENQLLNDVFVVNRTLCNIYLSSAPESRHVDRQARDLPEHQIDFVRNRPGMTKGWTTCKYFEKITNPHTSDSYFRMHYWRNAKVVRIIVDKPPQQMIDEYDKLREIGMRKKQQALKELKEKRTQDREEKGQSGSKGSKVSRADKKNARIARAQEVYDKMRLMGLTPKEARVELSKLPGDEKVPVATWIGWKGEGLVVE